LAGKFVAKAITLCPLVIILARLAFYESTGRAATLARCSRVHVFANRLPMMHRHGWEGPKSTSGVAFAWFVWDAAHVGPTTIDRIIWRNP
jgi:energy-converting hydrogenase Eha subunit G